MSSSVAQRRRSAYKAAAEAKQRRQKIFVIIGAVLFVAVMAYQVPKVLKSINSSSPKAAPVAAAPIAVVAPLTLPKAFRGPAVNDPFATRGLSGGDPQVGPAVGGHDPFAQPATQSAAPPVTPTAPAIGPLPQKIVIGTPTKGGAVARGWIVILASIPTREGKAAALAFARSARANGVSSVAVLNSSNRRPLRGGYWVVYTAPVPTLAEATQRAAGVHASGYSSAYLRELVVYK
jgi:hypothetical protein